MNVKAEREKQATKVHALCIYLLTRINEWVPLPELAAAIHSECGSTKISQARKWAAKYDSEIVWNRDPNASCYMLRARRLGRDASEQILSPWNQDRPYGESFKLTP